MSTKPLLELVDVRRVHGTGNQQVNALNGVSFSIHPGELVAIMGPSGCGKSTLLNIAGAMDSPTSGNVLIDGADLGTLTGKQLAAVRRQKVGFVFQELNLIPALTAAENIALPMELDGVKAKTARAQAIAALDELNLTELTDRYPDDMSGGQQQRVAIARALIGTRGLLLADEPTGALDSRTGDEILGVLRDRCDAGAAGLVVTHEARHAAWADRTLYLRDGEIVDDTGADTTDDHDEDLDNDLDEDLDESHDVA